MRPRILFVSLACWLDDSSGAMIASRAMMAALARMGFPSAAFTGTVFDHDREIDVLARIGHAGTNDDSAMIRSTIVDARGVYDTATPEFIRKSIEGVDVHLVLSRSTRVRTPSVLERETFLSHFAALLDRFDPDVVVGYGGDPATQEAFRMAKARGCATVFALHNFAYHDKACFASIDRVFVPSRFAAEHYRNSLGLECEVLPNLVDRNRVFAETRVDEQFVTFVNPSPEKGVWFFARIADELAKLRPEIPLLVVESRGTERTLVDCGLDLRIHGNVYLMAHTDDPRKIWKRTRICLMPSLWLENQPLTAIEAMTNGIPVIGSDRGGLPETLGEAGSVLCIPDSIRPESERLPEPFEVSAWVSAIIRLWDDSEEYESQAEAAKVRSKRWDSSVLETVYATFFENASFMR